MTQRDMGRKGGGEVERGGSEGGRKEVGSEGGRKEGRSERKGKVINEIENHIINNTFLSSCSCHYKPENKETIEEQIKDQHK